MDESWRRRLPTIQPHRVTDYLGPHDFRDVFGGPPRSVLLRHFCPSAQHADSGFRIITRDDNSPYNTVFCKPEFVSTIRCDRNGFQVTKREVETANKTDFYKPGLATSSRYGDNNGSRVMKKEVNLPFGKVLHKLDHMSTTCSMHGRSGVMKREEECSFIPVVHRRDDLSTACDDHDGFRFIEREDGSLYNTKSNLKAPTKYNAHNGLRVMKSEADDIFSEDVFGYKPISGQHSMTWSGNNKFEALKREEGFYNDIFGSVSVDSNSGLRRSRSRSISKSESESTAISCCEDGFLANAGYGDEGDRALASFAPKLRLYAGKKIENMLSNSSFRPITIPSKRYDSSPPSTISEGDCHNTLRYAGPACPSSVLDISGRVATNSNHPNPTNKSRCTASSFCCFTPPETLSLEPSFRLSFKKPASPEDNSPPLAISLSVPYKVKKVEKKVALEITDGVTTEERNFGSEVSAALDEAIAWAKERFMTQDDTIESKSEDFVGFKDWNATKGKYSADSKER